jgi:hypothetical protein
MKQEVYEIRINVEDVKTKNIILEILQQADEEGRFPAPFNLRTDSFYVDVGDSHGNRKT